MQVIQALEPEGYAIVGGTRTRAGGVASHAAAFRIMSDTLYRDKPRAVAREVICNAVDAHIAMGTPDLPVEVTISDHEMVVRDFGPGIPDEKIADIYLTLFESTKVQDTRQTGGFGLGSKAPFAMTDHFTVTNCHDGERYVYAIHRGDKSTDGLPGITLMGRSPCDTHGLTVSIPLERKEDADRLRVAVRSVVLEGGMKVKYNGTTVLETRDYSEIKRHGFGLMASSSSFGKIQILNANVLYPIEAHEELDADLARVKPLLLHNFDLVFYARPGSIGMTPSRENLSYDEETLATVRDMLQKAHRRFKHHLRRARKAELAAAVSTLSRQELANGLRDVRPPGLALPVYAGPEMMAFAHARQSIHRHGDLHSRDIVRAASRLRWPGARDLRLKARDPYLDESDLRKMTWAYLRKRAIRIAGQAGLLANLRYRPASERQLLPISKRWDPSSQHHPANGRTPAIKDPRLIVVAHNREIAATFKAAGFFIVNPKITDAQIARLKDVAFRFGVYLQVLDKPEPKKREPKIVVEKPKDRFTVLKTECVFNTTYESISCVVPKETIENPAAFYAAGSARSRESGAGFAFPSSPLARSLVDLLQGIAGPIALAASKREFKKLTDAGVPRIERVILDKIKARLDLKKPYEELYSAAAMQAIGGHCAVQCRMIRQSRRMTDLAHREPFVADPDRDAAWNLWLTAAALFHNRRRSTLFAPGEAETLKALESEYLKLRPQIKLPKGIYDHLGLFQTMMKDSYSVDTIFSKHTEDLIALIEFHTTRVDARKGANP